MSEAAPRYVESLRDALVTCMRSDSRVYLLGEDVVDPYGGAFKVSKGLSETFPDRVLATPISEAGLTGVGIGMALRGLRPVVEIMFADFLALCADQIVNHATKFRWMYNDQVRVPLVIRTPVGGYRGYGPTHSQSLESMFMAVPHLTIMAPSIYHNPGAMLTSAIRNHEDPVLFIEHKVLYPKKLVRPSDKVGDGELSLAMIGPPEQAPIASLCMDHSETPDATIIAYGYAAELSAMAAGHLYDAEELVVEVIVPSAIRPLPIEELAEGARRSGRVVIVEEGPRIGGWGSEVAAELGERLFGVLHTPIRRVGAPDGPIPTAKPMESQFLPSAASIANVVLEVV